MLVNCLHKKPLEKRLKDIENRLERLETVLSSSEKQTSVRSLDIKDLLEVPDSLRKTVLAIAELKEATANTTALKTGRTRSLETIYLNQLVRMGYLSRLRKGRKIYFKPLRYY
jgi:hypothetical protein